MPFIGLNEAIVIGAVVLALVLGPKKLPELARSIGIAKKEYAETMQEAEEVVEDVAPDAEEVEDLQDDR